MRSLTAGLSLVLAGSVSTAAQLTAEIKRTYASPAAFYAKSIVFPPGYETIRLPGIVPDSSPSHRRISNISAGRQILWPKAL
jgi:hypothetical protein